MKAPQTTATAKLIALLVGACALVVLSGPALANGSSAGPPGGPVVHIDPRERAIAREIDLSIGKSIVIDLPRDAKEVFVANPKVANAVVRSTRKVYLIGMDNGATSIFVLDADGRQIAALEVTVGRDLASLRQTLRTALPMAHIDVKPAGDSILLTGIVNSAAESQQAVDITTAFVGSSGFFRSTRGAVVNSLTIRGKDQVMLRVTVAEVARVVMKQFGINLTGSWSPLDFAFDNPLSLQRQPPTTFLSGRLNGGRDSNVTGLLQAFERAGVSRILAEPTLTAISGETAKFTAGGEIPVPAAGACEQIPGRRPECTFSLTFKPFGVTLTFTPLVLSGNRISLRVATEVTELDYENQFRIEGGGNIPATRVRKSETTVELPSGASLMTAGLIQRTSAQVVNGLPGLMNLPILGALFRSRDYQRNETELMILVTPFIAKPMEAAEVKRPDDGFIDPNDAQTILLGRLNKLYGVAGALPPAAVKGRFGFITE